MNSPTAIQGFIRSLHLRSLGKHEGILDVNAKIPDRALYLRMTRRSSQARRLPRAGSRSSN